MAVVFLLWGCNQQNDTSATADGKQAVAEVTANTTTTDSEVRDITKEAQQSTFAKIYYDDKLLLERTDFVAKVVLHDGVLIVLLSKDREEINISFGGLSLFKQKPYSGNFNLSPKENENTVLVSIHVEGSQSSNNSEKIKAPMFFGGTATVVQFNQEEVKVEINAKGGFYSDLDKPASWKPITGTVVVKSADFTQSTINFKNLLY